MIAIKGGNKLKFTMIIYYKLILDSFFPPYWIVI